MWRLGVPSLRLLAIALGLTAASIDRDAWAGAFVFAGEGNGVSVITHPQGYTGAGGTVTVEVCVDPTSANAASMELAVQNAVTTLARLEPVTANLASGPSNEVASNEVDFESTVLHELGHCVGLAHPNLGNESGLSGADTEYTRSTDGPGNSYGLDSGADGVRGSSDDLRGNDLNLFYFRIADNNPFDMEASVFDATTYSRDVGDLPTGHSFAANGERHVATLLGVSGATEAVMQQGAFFDEEQRGLTHDDVAMLRLAMSGVDEVQGTPDDYSLEVSYVGQSASCDVVLDFDDSLSSFASCRADGAYIDYPHAVITTATIYFNGGYNWFFTSTPRHCGNGGLDGGEQCDDGGSDPGDGCDAGCEVEPGWSCMGEPSLCAPPAPVCGNSALELGEDCDDGGVAAGDCCSPTCAFESQGSPCDDADVCTQVDRCDGAGACAPVSILDCDDGFWCNGPEICDRQLGCQPGIPVSVDDGVACTSDSCDEVLDAVVNVPNDLACDDGDWCNGAETCSGVTGCEPGSPEVVDACIAVPATHGWARALLAGALLVAGAGLLATRLRRPAA